jgi:hypothetical protein
LDVSFSDDLLWQQESSCDQLDESWESHEWDEEKSPRKDEIEPTQLARNREHKSEYNMPLWAACETRRECKPLPPADPSGWKSRVSGVRAFLCPL